MQSMRQYHTASLLRPARCFTPPPPFSGEVSVLGYFASITCPPPWATGAGLQSAVHAHVNMLQRVEEASIRKSSEGLRY